MTAAPALTPESVLAALRVPGSADPTALLLAFSGGLDSSVLLDLLRRSARRALRVRAVYVDHGLQPAAARWAAHCAAAAHSAGVEFMSHSVCVAAGPGESVEAAARRARYGLFETLLGEGEALLTAHHADDQLETVLMALLRGAGVDGLAGMPDCARLGAGWHLRPLLRWRRASLQAYASAHGLVHVEDPSNRDRRFSRNYLRNEVLPVIAPRWPSAAVTVGRSAGLCAEATRLLAELGAIDLESLRDGDCLDVGMMSALSAERARNALRQWLRERGVAMPSRRKLVAGLGDLLGAKASALPVLRWDGVELRRYRGRLHLMNILPAMPRAWHASLRAGQPLELPAGMGTLTLRRSGMAPPGAEPASFEVSFRSGGESLRLAGRRRHKLKRLLQAKGVVPWMRERIPLIYASGELVAVADLWTADSAAGAVFARSWTLRWQDHPRLY